MLAAHLTARLTASRTYQPSRPSETTYGDCLAACSWAWKAWRTITRPSAQRSVANPAFCVVTSPITGQTVPSGHGRSAGSVRDRLGGRRPQAPGPGAPDRPDGAGPSGRAAPGSRGRSQGRPPPGPAGRRVGPRRLGRQRGRVGDAAVDPAAQVVVLGMAVGGDQQPALHRPAGQVEGPDARLTLDRLDGVGGQPQIRSSPRTPQAMLPCTRKARPPNICFSASPDRSPIASRILVARPWSYAIAPSLPLPTPQDG
jgi:hypothetical protein